MKTRLLVLVLSALSIAPAAMAQLDMHQPSQVTIPTKFGVVNLRIAILGTADGKQAARQWQAQFAPRYSDLQNLQTRIEQDQTRLRNGESALSEQFSADLQDEIARLQRTYQRHAQDLQDDATVVQQEAINRIGRRIVNLLAKYSADNGYAMVLDSSSEQAPVLYAANSVDLTQQVIKLYDQNYPVKAEEPKGATPK